MAWAIWLTGLPGSGKSSIAEALVNKLKTDYPELEVEWLQKDKIQKEIQSSTEYTDTGRQIAYTAFINYAKKRVNEGKNIIIDAAGHKKEFRESARALIPKFYVIYIKCPLELAIKRESKRHDHPIIAKMYEQALKRLKGETVEEDTKELGQVIGIDIPYEEPENPELTIDVTQISAEEAAEEIFTFIQKNELA